MPHDAKNFARTSNDVVQSTCGEGGSVLDPGHSQVLSAIESRNKAKLRSGGGWALERRCSTFYTVHTVPGVLPNASCQSAVSGSSHSSRVGELCRILPAAIVPTFSAYPAEPHASSTSNYTTEILLKCTQSYKLMPINKMVKLDIFIGGLGELRLTITAYLHQADQSTTQGFLASATLC